MALAALQSLKSAPSQSFQPHMIPHSKSIHITPITNGTKLVSSLPNPRLYAGFMIPVSTWHILDTLLHFFRILGDLTIFVGNSVGWRAEKTLQIQRWLWLWLERRKSSY